MIKKFNLITISAFLLLQISASLAQETKQTKSVNPMAKYAKVAKIDEFNDAVPQNQKDTPKPRQGGEIILRIAAEPRTLNWITSTDATANYIGAMIYDSMITRDPETFEELPWIAKSWEVQDTIKTKDGAAKDGRITDENAETITFTEGGKKITLNKTDLTSFSVEKGEAVLKDGKTIKGKITDINYTIEIESPGKESQNIKISDLDTWKESSDGKPRPFFLKNVVFKFNLRDDVKWHDGTPFTSEDVVFSYETIMNKFVDAASQRNYYQDIEKLDAPDKYTVVFRYRRPYFKSLEFCGGMSILPKHKFDINKFKGDPEGFGKYFNEHETGNTPLGNGPYIFDKWIKGKQIELKANRNYWACNAGLPYWKKEQPYLDKLIYTVINNKTAAVKELQNGKVDVDLDVQTDTWFSDVTNSESFKKNFVRATNVTPMYTYIGWNMNRPWFKDKLTRQALSHVIPNQKILDDLYKGIGTIITGPFFINGPIYDKSIKPYEYSVEKSKQLLRKARWLDRDGDGILDKDGVKFEFEYLIHNALDIHQQTADIIKESVEKTGIKMNIRVLDFSVFSKSVSEQNFDAVRFAWATNIDEDLYQIFHSSQAERGGSNFISWKNPEADKMIEEARETFDDEKRWGINRKLHTLISEEQPYTFLFSPKEMFFYNNKFRNVKFYSSRPGYNFSEWYIEKKEK